MPEGDTILRAAHRLAVLAGQQLAVSAPTPRGEAHGVRRLNRRVLERVDTHGKHLILVFGDLALHSHLGMSGSWDVHPKGAAWRRSPSTAWALLEGDSHDAVQFNGSTLRVLRTSKLALDPTLSRLGPDILAPEFDLAQVVSRFRAIDQQQAVGDVLLDQRVVAGLGNIWRCEACFAASVSPWRSLRELSDEQLGSVLAAAREQMLASVASRREQFAIYGRRGTCTRCGGRVVSRGQGDANRTTWWCASCQT
jgi:endonuclease-8